MPLSFNLLETVGITLLNQGPGPMADILGILSFKALVTAIRLNIFEIIGTTRKSISELSSAAGADPVGMNLLVGILVKLGYLKINGGRISNSAMTKKWMLNGSPYVITDLFNSINDASMRWDYLFESISAGRPPLLGFEWLNEDRARWLHYHRGLKNIASILSPEIIRKIRIPSEARTILDLGGGHGHYCIELCRHYTGLSGVIFDWEPAGPVADQSIHDSGLEGRVTFQPGDFLTGSIGEGYDVILLFNVIRILDSDPLYQLLQKVRDALSPGGMVAIMDHMGYYPRSRFMGANAFLILLELYNSTTGRIHKAADVSGMLYDAGFSKVKKNDLARSPGLSLLQAKNV